MNKFCISSLLLLSLIALAAAGQSCHGRCGQAASSSQDCGCDRSCKSNNNCCGDYRQQCYSCDGRCGTGYSANLPCQCTNSCRKMMNCCNDYTKVCKSSTPAPVTHHPKNNTVTDAMLKAISNDLSLGDQNAPGLGPQGIRLNIQAVIDHKTARHDQSPKPLFAFVPELNASTYQTFIELRKIYKADSNVDDHPSGHGLVLVNDFINATMETNVMKTLQAFLEKNHLLQNVTLEQQLREMWFTPYSRAKGGKIRGSSGFEHVFIGELPGGGDIGGFHNWLSYYIEEQAGRANYFGYLRDTQYGSQAVINLVDSFTWRGNLKPVGGYLIGSSVEHDLAVFTLCWLARPDSKCPVQSHGVDYQVQTWVKELNGQRLVASSYPV